MNAFVLPTDAISEGGINMLRKLESENLIQAISYLTSTAKLLSSYYHLVLDRNLTSYPIDVNDCIDVPLHNMTVLEQISEQLGLIGVKRTLQQTRNIFNRARPHASALSRETIRALFEQLDIILTSFGNEFSGRQFYMFDTRFASFYTPDVPLFGEAVADTFPSTSYDIVEAGKCLALERSTACGFHLMRAAEATTAVALQHLGGNPQDDKGEVRPFGSLAQLIGTIVDEMPRGANKDEWLGLKAIMASMNRAFRTKIAHPVTIYTQEDAENLFNLTKSLMQFAANLINGREPPQ